MRWHDPISQIPELKAIPRLRARLAERWSAYCAAVHNACATTPHATRAVQPKGAKHDHKQARHLGTGGLERLIRVRHQHPAQPAGAHRPSALRAEDAGRNRLRPHSSGLRPDVVHEHHVLRLARLSIGQKNRAQRRHCAALGYQRPAHVRRRIRHHVADHAANRRSDQGLGSRADLGIHSELRAHDRRLRRALDSQSHPARGTTRHTGRAYPSHSSRCARRWKCS